MRADLGIMEMNYILELENKITDLQGEIEEKNLTIENLHLQIADNTLAAIAEKKVGMTGRVVPAGKNIFFKFAKECVGNDVSVTLKSPDHTIRGKIIDIDHEWLRLEHIAEIEVFIKIDSIVNIDYDKRQKNE